MPQVLLLGRPECHLCEDFDRELRIYLDTRQDGADWQVSHVCVDDRGEWRMRFGQRIPVLLDEAGDVLSEGFFDASRFGVDR